MYTNCIIRFVDDGDEWDVVIKNSDEWSDEENVFFYGMSRAQLLEACESGEVCEGEWKVIEVGETWN